MKVLITYSSKTGYTKKLADGIYNHIKNEGVAIMPIAEVTSLEAYDIVLVGYWVDKGGPNKEAAEFMETIKGKRVGIFATLGAYPDSQHGWDSLCRGAEIVEKENELIGRYICQGAVDEKIIELFRSFGEGNPHAITPAKLKRYEIGKLHPNEAEMLAAATLFKERF